MGRSEHELVSLGQDMERGLISDIVERDERIRNLERAISEFVHLHPQYGNYFAAATGIQREERGAA